MRQRQPDLPRKCSAVDPRRRRIAASGEHVDANEPRNPRAAETCRRGWAGSKDKTTKVPGLLLVHTSQAIRPRVSMPQVLARFQAGDFKRVLVGEIVTATETR